MKTEKTGQLQGRDENNRFLPGHSGNLKGRPLGSENFKTKLYKAIEKLAKDSQEEISVEDLEISIIEVGLKKAKEGDYKFWSDIFDRVYGKAQSNVELSTDGQSFGVVVLPAREDLNKNKGDENTLETT
tara:strand:+ start:111 stop:497 length:387 start_codon:yes stop_codon:yes gene_type:complete